MVILHPVKEKYSPRRQKSVKEKDERFCSSFLYAAGGMSYASCGF